MNSNEKKVAGQLCGEGWKVLSNGWPDFLCGNDAGDVIAVEVKRDERDIPQKNQQIMHELLKSAGIDVKVIHAGVKRSYSGEFVSTRLPAPLYRKVSNMANNERRSVSFMINILVEEAITARNGKDKKNGS